jgi:hypothetical protein
MRGRMGGMVAQFIIRLMLLVLCVLFVLFGCFNDNPYERQVGGLSYLGFVSAIGIALCVGALYWLNRKGRREE